MSLEPLFAADPLLLYDFMYLCHEGEYTKLFQNIPTYLSLSWLCCHAKKNNYFHEKYVSYLYYV